MASKQAHAAVTTTIFDRLMPVRVEIEERKFPPDLEIRIAQIGHDTGEILARGGDATAARTARLSDIAGELVTGRAAADAGKTQEAWAAFTRAVGCIDAVCAEVAGELPP